jgi:hypothetical protein
MNADDWFARVGAHLIAKTAGAVWRQHLKQRLVVAKAKWQYKRLPRLLEAEAQRARARQLKDAQRADKAAQAAAECTRVIEQNKAMADALQHDRRKRDAAALAKKEAVASHVAQAKASLAAQPRKTVTQSRSRTR